MSACCEQLTTVRFRTSITSVCLEVYKQPFMILVKSLDMPTLLCLPVKLAVSQSSSSEQLQTEVFK